VVAKMTTPLTTRITEPVSWVLAEHYVYHANEKFEPGECNWPQTNALQVLLVSAGGNVNCVLQKQASNGHFLHLNCLPSF